MNTMPRQEHPAEEELMEFALHEGVLDIGDHVKTCPACAKAVKEFREVGKQVASLADEEVPERVEQHVLGLSRHGTAHGHGVTAAVRGRALGLIFTNPVFIALLVALLVIALYFLVGSEVVRAP